MKSQIDYDIAWETFDEVNKYNDTYKVFDLNCLETTEAQSIMTAKLLDLAKKVNQKYKKHLNTSKLKKNYQVVI